MNQKLSKNLTIVNPKKEADKEWYLSLLDEEAQKAYEDEHMQAVLFLLKARYISHYKAQISALKKEIEEIQARPDYSAADYKSVLEKQAEQKQLEKKLESYHCFFSEPYFARMDVTDDKEGYNSYYIGKKGDINLEIVDWRSPLAARYYQKSRVTFQINEYFYRAVLRRAISVKNGKVLGFKNEYLSVKDVLTKEEIAGRDEEILFDPYLRSIILSRKDDTKVRDIIETIQEKQFEIVTRPERESFALQGCAGSGKTMIMLHRLSYLIYNNESLRPVDILVITPSDSFNAFIDELSRVLELQKVKTITLQNYYFQALKREGLDLQPKLSREKERGEYLRFVYSDEFCKKTDGDLNKLYLDIFALISAEECRQVAEKVYEDCVRRREKFTKVKNASLRVRRAVLGELKEKKEGGFYFTKPLRALMGAYGQAEEFLKYTLYEKTDAPIRFFTEFAQFYRNAKLCAQHSRRVFAGAKEDLVSFSDGVDKEIADLKRYRRKIGNEFVYTYADRIARRGELKEEIASMLLVFDEMEEGADLFSEFFEVISSQSLCAELGKCENGADVCRWLYRKTIKQYKARYNMKGVYPSDGFALCYLLTKAGRQLKPRYGLVFVDEGQDLSPSEYRLLRAIHSDAAFNIFGDLQQNITPWRGVQKWQEENVYELDRNYRNTNEIVEYVADFLNVDMVPIGLHGEAVAFLKMRQVSAFFKGKSGLKAVIAREEALPLFAKRGYKRLSQDGLSKTRVNVMTVYESKGLEFSAVAVYEAGMTIHERYIACTRALKDLAVIEEISIKDSKNT